MISGGTRHVNHPVGHTSSPGDRENVGRLETKPLLKNGNLDVPGAILRVRVDTDHWLSAGQDGEMQPLIEGNRVFAPLRLNSGRNAGLYATKDRLVASGLVWAANQDLLVQKPCVMHQPFGQGYVVAFAEDANYRAFSKATMLLFMTRCCWGRGIEPLPAPGFGLRPDQRDSLPQLGKAPVQGGRAGSRA
jgi:hypothetical protein